MSINQENSLIQGCFLLGNTALLLIYEIATSFSIVRDDPSRVMGMGKSLIYITKSFVHNDIKTSTV
jgi:hypothetical protein